MSVRNDVVNLIVNVNGNKAQNELNQLRKRAADIKFEMQGLKKGTAEYIAKSNELKQVTEKMGALKKQIGITALTQKELVKELASMKALKASMQPFTDEWKKLDKEIKKVESRLYDVKNGVQGFSSFFSKIKDEVKQFGLIAAGYLGFQFLASSVSNIIQSSGKLSDQLADIQRVTGLTADEVQNLNGQLTNLDTRTSTSGLREIAVIAGKLGVAKDDIFGFTVAVDKLGVALGGSLGDADQVTTELGKILNVFEGSITADNITKLGNAIVELDNKGTASAPFIVDFTQRLAGLAETADLTLDASIGLAAGLEETGQRSESASTAVINLLGQLGNDVKSFAKAAGKDVNDFAKTVKERPVEALLQLAEGVVKNKSGLQELSPAFKALGIDGVRVQTVLGVLGGKADFFRRKIDEAGGALKDTNAIQQAFILKNNTFGAELDKLGKNINRLFVNSGAVSFFQTIVKAINNTIGPTKTAVQQFDELNSKVTSLEKNVLPLANRYDELKKKTNLSAAEQKEMKSIVEQVAGAIPSAISQVDAYGNAIAISTSRVRDYINTEKDRLTVVNAKAIEETTKDLNKANAAFEFLQKRIDERNQKGFFSVQVKGEQGDTFTRKATEKEIQELDANYKLIISKRNGLNAELKRLNGQGLEEQLEQNKKAAEEQKKLQDQNKVPDSPEDAKEKEKKLKKLRDEAAEFRKEIEKLQQELAISGKAADEQEVARIEAKYKELLEKAKKYNFDLLTIEGLKATELEQLFNKRLTKGLKEFNEQRYNDAIEASTKLYRDERNAALTDFATRKIDKATYEAQIRAIDIRETNDRIAIGEKYTGLVKKAAEDITSFKKKQEEQVTKDLLDEANTRAEISKQEKEAKLKSAIIRSPKGSDNRLQAQKDLLQLQFEQETEFLDKKSELYKLKQAELNESIKELETESLQQRVENVLAYARVFQDVMQSLANYSNERENRLLLRDRTANDEKKKNFKKQLDSKLINEAQYNQRIEQLDAELEKKEKIAKRNQAKREKSLNIFNSLINTASAVAEALPNIPLSIAVGIAGAIQTGLIAATPLPELGKGDWIRKGDKHSDASRGITAKIERNEAVMAASAMTNNEVLTVTGTTAQITSALNSRKGGTNWAGGAVVEMPAWRTATPARINPNMPKILEQGGIVRNIDGLSGSAAQQQNDALMKQLIEEVRTMKRELHAVVSIKEFREKEQVYDAAKKVSGLNS